MPAPEFGLRSGLIAFGPGAGVCAVGLKVDASPGSWLEDGFTDDFNKLYSQILDEFPGYKHIVVSEKTDFSQMTAFSRERFFRFLLEAPRQFQFILRTEGLRALKLPGTKVHLSLQIRDGLSLDELFDRADSLCLYWDCYSKITEEALLRFKDSINSRQRVVYLVLESSDECTSLDRAALSAAIQFCTMHPGIRLSVPIWFEFA